MSENMLTSSQVAKLFNVTTRTIQNWAKNGIIAYIKTPSGQYRFPESKVNELLDYEQRLDKLATMYQASRKR